MTVLNYTTVLVPSMTLILEHGAWFTFWFFIFGTVIGSFLNVVILRFESDEPLTGRSHCPKCGRTLTWKELVPVLSYLVQRGKCIDCEERISIQYPLVEFATGILFALVFLTTVTDGASASSVQPLTYAKLVLELCIWSILVVIAVYDLRTTYIPDVFSLTFISLSLLLALTEGKLTLAYLGGGILLFAPFFLLWWLSNQRAMGIGDGKLALGIGWFLGLEYGGSAILVSFWMGAGVSLAVIAYQRLRIYFSNLNTSTSTRSSQPPTPNLSLKSEIPFGPFMVLGTLFVWLFHWSILSFIY